MVVFHLPALSGISARSFCPLTTVDVPVSTLVETLPLMLDF